MAVARICDGCDRPITKHVWAVQVGDQDLCYGCWARRKDRHLTALTDHNRRVRSALRRKGLNDSGHPIGCSCDLCYWSS